MHDDTALNMAIRPNPVRDQLAVRYTSDTPDDVRISILDAKGQIIRQHTSYPIGEDILLDVNDLAQGFYFIQLSSGDTQLVEKFVKQ